MIFPATPQWLPFFGVDTERVAKVLSQWVQRATCPVRRTRNHGGGASKYLYYIPELVNPHRVVGAAPVWGKPKDEPVNTVNPPRSFEFNPIELGEQRVTLPSAKRITLEVGGVKISIELGE